MSTASPHNTAAPSLGALLHQLLEAEVRAEEAETRAQTAEQAAESATERATSAEARVADLTYQVAAQEKIIAALMARVGSLTRRLAAASTRPEQLALQLELEAVQRRLDELNHEKFGQKSERRGRPPGSPAKEKPARKPKTGHGPRPQPRLPREPQTHLLDEADRVCPNCLPPRPLLPLKGRTDDSEEVTVVERTFKVILHRNQLYGCKRCGHIEAALGPERHIPGGRYSTEFAATVAVDKYRDHLPLARQAQRMAEAGLEVTRQTLWDQIAALYVLLLPCYLALQARILESDVVFADETWWRYIQKGGSKRWWIWVVADGLRVFFLLAATRGQAAALELLRGYDGIVMADRYVVYESLEKAKTKSGGEQLDLYAGDEESEGLPMPDYTLAACWMHARRGFVKSARQGEAQADFALDLIAELYAIEAKAEARVLDITDPDSRQAALLETRRHLRDVESRGVIERLRIWLEGVPTIPGLPLHEAVRWVTNGWVQLTRFLEDPKIPLDNGEAERAARTGALGRRVHGGSRSVRGTQVAALFYSLVESCRVVGVDARAYLIEASRRALADRGSVFLPEDYAGLLADRAAEERRAATAASDGATWTEAETEPAAGVAGELRRESGAEAEPAAETWSDAPAAAQTVVEDVFDAETEPDADVVPDPLEVPGAGVEPSAEAIPVVPAVTVAVAASAVVAETGAETEPIAAIEPDDTSASGAGAEPAAETTRSAEVASVVEVVPGADVEPFGVSTSPAEVDAVAAPVVVDETGVETEPIADVEPDDVSCSVAAPEPAGETASVATAVTGVDGERDTPASTRLVALTLTMLVALVLAGFVALASIGAEVRATAATTQTAEVGSAAPAGADAAAGPTAKNEIGVVTEYGGDGEPIAASASIAASVPAIVAAPPCTDEPGAGAKFGFTL
jgi:transposase